MAGSLKKHFNNESSMQYPARILLKELTNPGGYKIVHFKAIETRYGESRIAAVDVPEKKGVFEVFLPQRFTRVLTPERITEYNKNPNLKLIYKGIGPHNEHIVVLD